MLPAIANLNLAFRPETDGAYRTRVLSGGDDVTEGVYSAKVEADCLGHIAAAGSPRSFAG